MLFEVDMPVVRRLFAGTSLESAYSGRDNAFNFMRLCFALLVIVGHAAILGWGPGREPVVIPFDTGGVAVTGFFGLSGFLISYSGRRSSPLRYIWHRMLRIFPGYWVCLAASAFVLAPLLFWHEHGTLSGFRSAGPGPLGYIYHNFLTDQRQADVAHVTGVAPYPNALNGSLWTLKSELTCYLLVLALAVTLILRRARWVVLLLGAAMFSVVVYDTFSDPVAPGPIADVGPITLPILGTYQLFYLWAFGLAFVLGMIADVYRDKIPLNDTLGVTALVLSVLSLYLNLPLFGPCIVAYVYLLLWAGVRLPKALRKIGRRNDYSYGVYIYAFPAQQALAILGVPRFGWTFYLLTSVVAALILAVCSWYLVEKPALRAKHWSPGRRSKPSADVPASELPPAADPSQESAPHVPAPRLPESVEPEPA
ncbi:acyltransferase [Dactylosporangium salmoneum]|uniref:acyltransferase family protein n=1 Tax=Dactylosporangium salmoneum TaxID=53361 RepID=UPI0031D7A3D0